MVKLLVITVVDKNIGITQSDNVDNTTGLALCQAGVQYFQEQIMEAEVQRRLAEEIANED